MARNNSRNKSQQPESSTPPPTQSSPPLSVEVAKQFLEIQSRELDLRNQELLLRQQTDKNSFDYSKLAMDAQIKDRERQRTHKRQTIIWRYIFGTVFFVILTAFLTYALYIDKENIVTEVIKAIILFGGGGLGGYGLAKSGEKSSDSSENDEN